MAQNTILYLGAGGNIGASSVHLFKSKGYKVASVARTMRKKVTEDSDLVMTADFMDPTTIKGIFETVDNPLSTPIGGVQKDIVINIVSAYAAAQAAVESFDKAPQ
ncbi:hypothetical protein D6C81_09996 [Aureobasidium pullulans]|uniref:NAD(P)-binding domain-containing protein n=1 Tax=Aureobasidium pullulans TaxID=5580 RepID=A0A4S9ZN74_AURPU|nr:hypothetical protein D6D22_06857 [Aureobasidium pullulans]TIA06232.1 hypothetical protein D6C81_09996 [Aureobasidium pullulans]